MASGWLLNYRFCHCRLSLLLRTLVIIVAVSSHCLKSERYLVVIADFEQQRQTWGVAVSIDYPYRLSTSAVHSASNVISGKVSRSPKLTVLVVGLCWTVD